MSYTAEEKFQKLVKDGQNRKHDNGIDRTLQLCNFDEHQIDLGCQTFHKHFFSMFVTMLTGEVIDTKYWNVSFWHSQVSKISAKIQIL